MTRDGSRLARSAIIVALVLLAKAAAGQTSPGEPGAVQPTLEARPEPAGSIAERVVAEFMVGSGFATIGFLAGPKIVTSGCSTCVFAAGFAGASAMFPVGAYAGGRLVRGKGNFWLTVAAPWVVSATTIVALARDDDYNGRPAFEIGTIGGSIAAPLSMVMFELSNAWVRAHTSQSPLGAPSFQAGLVQSRGGVTMWIAKEF